MVGARTALSARTWLSALRFMGGFHLQSLDAHRDHEPQVCLTLTRNLTPTLRSSIKSKSRSKSKKSRAKSEDGVILTIRFMGRMMAYVSYGSARNGVNNGGPRVARFE